jgi:hypothetical protein
MVLASGSQVLFSYLEEVTRGTTPGSGTPQLLRATQRAINLTKNVLTSNEVRPSGQTADARHGFRQIGGSVGFQLSYTDHDDLLALAMRNTWAAKPTAVSGVALTIAGAGGGDFTLTRASGSFVTDGYVAGSLLLTTGFVNTLNNSYWVVKSRDSATQLTVYDPANLVTNEVLGAGGGITSFRRLAMGNTMVTWSMEREIRYVGGGGTDYQMFRGVSVNTLALSVSPEQIITGTAGFLGIDGGTISGSTGMPGAATDPSSNEPYASFDGALLLDGIPNLVVTGFEMTINNNRSTEAVVGAYVTPDLFEGTATISGTLTAFMEESNVLYNAFVNETEFPLGLLLIDPSGNRMFVYAPRVKLTSAELDPPQSGPVPMSCGFQVLEDADLATSLLVYSD